MQLRYELLDAGTGAGVTAIDRFFISFYDFDAGISQVQSASPALECMQMGDSHAEFLEDLEDAEGRQRGTLLKGAALSTISHHTTPHHTTRATCSIAARNPESSTVARVSSISHSGGQ